MSTFHIQNKMQLSNPKFEAHQWTGALFSTFWEGQTVWYPDKMSTTETTTPICQFKGIVFDLFAAPPLDFLLCYKQWVCSTSTEQVCFLFFYLLTIQDQPVWCLSWEELQMAKMLAWPWFHRQVSATSPLDAMTTGVAAGFPRNGVGHDAGQQQACRTVMWKTHWGSSLEALYCPEKRQKSKSAWK